MSSDYNVSAFRKIPREELDKIIAEFVEVELLEPFPIIRETLTRVGILKRSVLYQTAHILHKKSKYYIVHFKHLFALDGRDSTYNEEDKERLYKIIFLLKKWNLIKILNKDIDEYVDSFSEVFVNIAKVEDIRENKVLLKKKYNL